MRESYSFMSESKKNNIKIKNQLNNSANPDYMDYTESGDTTSKVSSKMKIRNDPQFQSEYNFAADEQVSLPPESTSQQDVPPVEEFKHLMQSSEYLPSTDERSMSPSDQAIPMDKSSAVHVRQTKYTIFPTNSIEKPTAQVKNRRGLFNAGENVISSNLSLSQDRAMRNSHAPNISAYAPKSSEHYPSASTALGSNATMIRIRGKNNKVVNKKG
jgi:hypothetical protein